MHFVEISDGELELLKQAKRDRDWTILPTWKLRYLYQRFVALPAGDAASLKEIVRKAEDVRKLEY